MSPTARIGTLLAVATVLAGCGGSTEPSAPTVSAVPPSTSTAAPAGTSPEDVVCAEYTDSASLVRRIAETVETTPVVPAAIALVLFDSRRIATAPGVQDPELLAAQTELLAAIDDLDAQGRVLLGPDGNPAQDTVRLDAERILAAVTEIERVCGSR